MKIRSIHIRNFRTIEALDIEMPWPFTAICGANDAGKTNIIRAIRALLRDDQPYFAGDDDEVSVISLGDKLIEPGVICGHVGII